MTFRNAITIAQKMELSGGHSNGFAYMRLFLATSVVIWHTVVTSYGQAVQDQIWLGPYRAANIFMLPIFFALSGFLVSASLDRCRTPISFLGLRVLRIFPALALETLLCALVLGPLLTHLPLGDYFSAKAFWAYFLNAFGIIHKDLPGVFADNPLPEVVNGQLWTIMAEMGCYFGLAVLSLVALRYKWLLLIFFVLFQAMFVFWIVTHPGLIITRMTGLELGLCFTASAGLYKFRHRIPWHGTLGLLALLAMIGLLSLNCGTLLVAIPTAYFTVWLSLMSPKMPAWLRSNDYSYGIYLFSFPIQQMVATQAWAHSWYINGLISLPLTLLAAVVSWHLLEKPVMKRKKMAYHFEDWLLTLWNRYRPVKPSAHDMVGE
ncbi:MAG: acyltransferase [Asticcacaulis sp.]|uniref:acyltransferase family protein n=1 Tax=Asticcacaulis sp. TaxID=1872648 RepID=UPI0039E26983